MSASAYILTKHLASCQVISTDFSPQDWSENTSHYTVVVEAALDNRVEDESLPLAPWY